MERPTESPRSGNQQRTLLLDEHARIDQSLERLSEAFRADPRGVGLEEWKRFEAEVRSHLELEEGAVFPEFTRVNPDEVRTLLREHDAIRRELEELAVGGELHLVTREVIDSLARRLRDHARREDALLYRWIEAGMPPAKRAHVDSRLLTRRTDAPSSR